MVTATLDRWRTARYDAFRWRYELGLLQKLALALGMACLTGLLAQIRVPLPFTPIPVTGQTFAVLLAGVMLGRWWGGLSQAIYAGLGVAGLPWFNGWSGGISHLAGPTGGYIVGFILTALFIGYITDKYIRARKFYTLLGLMLVADFVLVYTPGLLQLGLWLNLVKGQSTSFNQLLAMGLLPFILGDIIKVVLAAGLGWAIVPKKSYGNEADRPG